MGGGACDFFNLKKAQKQVIYAYSTFEIHVRSRFHAPTWGQRRSHFDITFFQLFGHFLENTMSGVAKSPRQNFQNFKKVTNFGRRKLRTKWLWTYADRGAVPGVLSRVPCFAFTESIDL